MSDQNPPNNENQDAWREVGQQFEKLGESIAAAFKTAWQDENNRQEWVKVRDGLESMAQNINAAIHAGVSSPEAQEFGSKVKSAATRATEEGKQAVHEARPHVVTALRKVSTELEKLIAKMDAEKPAGPDQTSPE